MAFQNIVYHLGYTEAVGCHTCQANMIYTEFKRGEAFSVSAGHSPCDGNSHFMCKAHLDDDPVFTEPCHHMHDDHVINEAVKQRVAKGQESDVALLHCRANYDRLIHAGRLIQCRDLCINIENALTHHSSPTTLDWFVEWSVHSGWDGPFNIVSEHAINEYVGLLFNTDAKQSILEFAGWAAHTGVDSDFKSEITAQVSRYLNALAHIKISHNNTSTLQEAIA